MPPAAALRSLPVLQNHVMRPIFTGPFFVLDTGGRSSSVGTHLTGTPEYPEEGAHRERRKSLQCPRPRPHEARLGRASSEARRCGRALWPCTLGSLALARRWSSQRGRAGSTWFPMAEGPEVQTARCPPVPGEEHRAISGLWRRARLSPRTLRTQGRWPWRPCPRPRPRGPGPAAPPRRGPPPG